MLTRASLQRQTLITAANLATRFYGALAQVYSCEKAKIVVEDRFKIAAVRQHCKGNRRQDQFARDCTRRSYSTPSCTNASRRTRSNSPPASNAQQQLSVSAGFSSPATLPEPGRRDIHATRDVEAWSVDELRPRTQIDRKAWPLRLQEFFGSLPVRNYANDFILWDMNADDVWKRYQLLPEPRCLAISRTALRFVLGALASVKPRTKKGMLRYASIIDEMKAQIPPCVPIREEWNALISFHARLHKRPGINDVEACMQTWAEMQCTFGVMPDITTFNILLDVSTKARTWQTVDLLLQEMQSREIMYDKYTWNVLVYGAGLRQDGYEVRRLTMRMAEHDQSLDLVDMNNVISALLRCGDFPQAEGLFQAMKASKNKKAALNRDKYVGRDLGLPTSNDRPVVSKELSDLASGREDRSSFTGLVSVYPAPDVATYNMMLKHACSTDIGDFARVKSLLDEMDEAAIPDTHAMYESLLQGFRRYGNQNKIWDLPKLQYVFETFLKSSEVKITQTLAIHAIEAFSVLGNMADLDRCCEALDQAWQAQGGDSFRRSTNVLRTVEAARLRLQTRQPSVNIRQVDQGSNSRAKVSRQSKM